MVALSVGCASAGESGRAAGHSRFARRSESESCAGGHHRRPARADGGNDLLMVDPLKVDRRGGQVGVPELALDDLERDALAGGLERVGVAELVRREPAPDPLASRRIRGLAAAGCGRARSAAGRPSITQNSDPAGSAARTVSHGRNCSQPVVDAESAAPARTCPGAGPPRAAYLPSRVRAASATARAGTAGNGPSRARTRTRRPGWSTA